MDVWDELPAFEVRDPATGHVYRIWYSGRTEGFPEGASLVVNRIPAFMTLFAGAVVAAEMGDAGETAH